MAAIVPNFPISPAKSSSFNYNGVGGVSYCSKKLTEAWFVLDPTYKISINPEPSTTLDPEMRNGSPC